MRQPLFNLERASRITAFAAQTVNHAGSGFREGTLVDFQQLAANPDGESCQSLRLSSVPRAGGTLGAYEALRLHEPAYRFADGGSGVSLTYVLRHSAAGLRWSDGRGESARLSPGSLHISPVRQDCLVEIAPDSREGPCECIRVNIRTGFAKGSSLRREAYDFPFCNSAYACVRVILGQYRDHCVLESSVPQVCMLDIDLAPYSDVEIPLAADRWALAILTSGSMEYCGSAVEPLSAIAFNGCEPLARIATQSGASVLWLDLPSESSQPVAATFEPAAQSNC